MKSYGRNKNGKAGKQAMMRFRSLAAIILMASVMLFPAGTAKAEGEESVYDYRSGTEAGEAATDLFLGSELAEKQAINRTVLFSVSDLKSDKACLFLTAEPNMEKGGEEWTEYAGTPEGIYERLFQVREQIFDLNLSSAKRGELNRELGQLYADTYRADPESVSLYDNAYTLLLKKLSCTVEEEGKEEEKKECLLQQKTPLWYLGEGESRKIRITLRCTENLDSEERELLQSIRWHLTADEYNSAPGFDMDIMLKSQPENGEYFVTGETVSIQMTYQNTGNINLMHVIARLMKEGSREERTELDHDVQKLMTSKKTPGQEGSPIGGLGIEFKVTSADAKKGYVLMFAEAEATCTSPEYPDRIRVEKELRIPAGEVEKDSEKKETSRADTVTEEGIREKKSGNASVEEPKTSADGTDADISRSDGSRERTAKSTGIRARWLILILLGASAIVGGLLIIRCRRRGNGSAD